MVGVEPCWVGGIYLVNLTLLWSLTLAKNLVDKREAHFRSNDRSTYPTVLCTRNYNPTMDTTEIIQTIDAEIARLEKARALLNGHTASPKPQRRKMSAEGRARIAAAQKARWAKAKK